MKKYKVAGSNKFNGNKGEWTIEAENEKELKGSFFCKGLFIDSIEEIGESDNQHDAEEKNVVEIPDAEALLFEMDAAGANEITIIEGFGARKTYAREEIEKQLGL